MNIEELDARTRDKYCEEHELFHMKNALGHFVCPFCEANLTP